MEEHSLSFSSFPLDQSMVVRLTDRWVECREEAKFRGEGNCFAVPPRLTPFLFFFQQRNTHNLRILSSHTITQLASKYTNSLLPLSLAATPGLSSRKKTTMDKFQRFRLTGQPKVEKILCAPMKGYDVIFWDDIQQVYPDVKHVKCEDVTVSLLRDLDHRRYKTDVCTKTRNSTAIYI